MRAKFGRTAYEQRMRTKPKAATPWIPAGVAAVLVSVAAMPAAQPVSAASPAPEPAPLLTAAVQSKIDADVRAALNVSHTQGATIAIVRDGAVVFTRGYGMRDPARSLPADEHTRYEIGSITKQFTAAAILQLNEARKIDLDAPVATYIPSAPHAGEVTVRELLSHTSGLADYTDVPTFDTLAATPATFVRVMSQISGKPLGFTPGTAFAYSNTNYLILGRIVELVSGQTWETYVQQHLFVPAGMRESATMAEEDRLADMARGYVYAHGRVTASKPISESWASSAGGIVSTADDLRRWAEALSSGRIISRPDYELLTSPGRLADGSTTAYGFGLKVDRFEDQPRIWHDGNTNGFDGSDQFFPNQGVRIIVLTNTLAGGSDAIVEHVYNDLFPAIASAAARAAEPQPSGPPPAAGDEGLYARTVAIMRELPEPRFLTFVLNVTLQGDVSTTLLDRHGIAVLRVWGPACKALGQPSGSWASSHRARDDLASVANTPESHLLTRSPLFNPAWTGVYDWLRYGIDGRPFAQKLSAQPSPAPNEQLKRIGTVTALAPNAYRIVGANGAVCPGGQQGRHLALGARDGNVLRHPLTDVTIDRATMRFCSMRFHVFAQGGVSFAELHFGTGNGYWMTTRVDGDFRGFGQFGIGGRRASWHITYSDMRFPDALDDALFTLPVDQSVPSAASAQCN
jgi:CubicO group peptidase (beta-lactamase class C family)